MVKYNVEKLGPLSEDYVNYKRHLSFPRKPSKTALPKIKNTYLNLYPKIQPFLSENRNSPLIRRNLFRYYQHSIPKKAFLLGRIAGELFDVKVIVYRFIPHNHLKPYTTLLFIGPRYNVYFAIRLFRYLYSGYNNWVKYVRNHKGKSRNLKAAAQIAFISNLLSIRTESLANKYASDKVYLSSIPFTKLRKYLDRVFEVNFPMNIKETPKGKKSKRFYGTKINKCLNPWLKKHHYEGLLKEKNR
jgi:hypothetical protein